MPNYRRYYVPGGTYFFTLVTQNRKPILTTDLGRTALRVALEEQQKKRPFEIIAFVLLPDHLHAVWTLPRDDAAYSLRWAQIKESFTRDKSWWPGSYAVSVANQASRARRMAATFLGACLPRRS